MTRAYLAFTEKGLALAEATTRKLVEILSDERIWGLPV